MEFEQRGVATRADRVPKTLPDEVALHEDAALHDEVAAAHPEVAGAGTSAAFDPLALLPWFAEDGPSPHVLARPPAVLAYGSTPPVQLNPNTPAPAARSPLPLADEANLQARADRMQAEQLLQSKRLETGEDASKAVDLLLQVPGAQRAKAIDELDPKAFANLLDRVPAGEREKIEGLVDASQSPKRKLQMWSMVHKARATNDLSRYEGNFGDDSADDQTDAQKREQQAFERRERGVESDAGEVDREVDQLMAKDKKGVLTVADVDAMRHRKDLELKVEMDYNVNLVAESTPRDNGTPVQWTETDLRQTQTALSQIPADQLHDPMMASTLIRRASRFFGGPRGEYHAADHSIDISDNAESPDNQARVVPPRSLTSEAFRKEHGSTVDPLEYTLTHEIGHNVADENRGAFEKFRNVGHWNDSVSATQARSDGATDEDVTSLEQIRRSADEGSRLSVARGGKRFSPGNQPDKGTYAEVDETAVPATGHMTYAAVNSQEHFAEVYAQAVMSPQALYSDYVADPTRAAERARASADASRKAVAVLEADPSSDPGKLAAARQALADQDAKAKVTATAQQQQGQEFAIMRNDVFGTDKAQAGAEGRLRAGGVAAEHLSAFRERAAQASTPQQIEELEREAKATR